AAVLPMGSQDLDIGPGPDDLGVVDLGKLEMRRLGSRAVKLDRLQQRCPRVEEVRLLQRQYEAARAPEVVSGERARYYQAVPALVEHGVAEEDLVGVRVAKRMPHGGFPARARGDPARACRA